MTQPDHVPVAPADRVRQLERLPAPSRWRADRPGDITGVQPVGPGLGVPGPDQGFGLKLAHRFATKLQLVAAEHTEDAVVGCLGVGLRRAALFGRGPVIYDFELAYDLWGFLGGAPADLVEFRRPLFEAVAHDYARQRDIVDLVPEATLRLTPMEVHQRLADWKTLLGRRQ
ncbi:MAG TPA: hypothetical protein VM030_05360 [Acidimicrobiales bacterium]|nr:hypothetical protein [Acidimicrobiales bacterium]